MTTLGEILAREIAGSADLAGALADERGVPLVGRRREYALLIAAGAQDLAWGRLYEGHVNALQLAARLGDARVRQGVADDAHAGRLFGVWNTEADDGVRILADDTLAGRKTFASGAGRVARALITARRTGGRPQLLLVPMDRLHTPIDRSFWRAPFGMENSDSFAVAFDGVRLDETVAIGGPDRYEEPPWFTAGAARFVAVQTGAIVALVQAFAAFLRDRHAASQPYQMQRLGECAVLERTARLWVDACSRAWSDYDARPDTQHASALEITVDGARHAVERAALDVMEHIERGVGARGLLEPEPFARRIRDLRMYLRQPAVDAPVARVGQATLNAADTPI